MTEPTINSDAQTEDNGLELDEEESLQLQEVFSAIFPQYLEPLDELVRQLADGRSAPEIYEGLRGAVTPLLGAAQTIGVASLLEILQEFRDIVAELGDGEPPSDDERDAVVDVFYRLRDAVGSMGGGSGGQSPDPAPAASGADGTEPGRSNFVEELSAVPGVGPDEIQRILAAGINSRSKVIEARVDEIAAVSGIVEALASSIQDAFGGPTKSRPRRPASKHPSREGPDSASDAAPLATEGAASDDAWQSETAPIFRLVAALRERIYLEDRLQAQQRECVSARRTWEHMQQRVLRMKVVLQESRARLAAERQRIVYYEARIGRIRDAAKVSRGAAVGVAPNIDNPNILRDVEERLKHISARVAKRLG